MLGWFGLKSRNSIYPKKSLRKWKLNFRRKEDTFIYLIKMYLAYIQESTTQ
jgi:hypothetical protein